MNVPKVTLEILSMSSMSTMVVSLYPACIVNGVRFVTRDQNVRLKTHNSGVSVMGTGNEIFLWAASRNTRLFILERLLSCTVQVQMVLV